jgi:hypothetical protein
MKTSLLGYDSAHLGEELGKKDDWRAGYNEPRYFACQICP